MNKLKDIKPDDHILVAWSGGLDSTYLIWKALQTGAKVDAAYFELVNNSSKIKREQKAIEQLRQLFELNPNFKYLGTTVKFEIGDEHEVIGSYLQQVPIWLASMVYSYNENHDKIALGYVMGDDDISYLPEIKNIYNAISKMFKVPKIPKLIVPLCKTKKEEELVELPYEIINVVTFCENLLEIDNCGKCPPCRWWKYIEESGYVPWQCYRFKPKEEPKIEDYKEIEK